MPFLSQFVSGLAAASPLFLVAAGLTLTVGVSRTANLSLGVLAVLGADFARIVVSHLPPSPASVAFGIIAAAAATAALGAMFDLLILRRLRGAPALFAMAATLGIALFIHDLLPLIAGDPGPSQPAIAGPIADIAQIALGPSALAGLLLLLMRTRWGASIRAVRLDPALTAALGVDPRRLQTSVAALGSGLAGLAGAALAMQGPIGPGLDMDLLTGALVVVVIGGLGSVTGAYVAAVLVGLAEAFGALILPHATLVPAVALLAIILMVRPSGLLGRRIADRPPAVALVRPTPASIRLLGIFALVLAAAAPFLAGPDVLAIVAEGFIAVLFAASLQMLLGPGGMPSLGHAAFFGIGAYAAATLARDADLDLGVALVGAPIAAGAVALLVGALVVRVPGMALAMVTLVMAQLVLTLAHNDPGWPGQPLPASVLDPALVYWFTLTLCIGVVLLLRRALSAPFGYALRATRDDPRRALAIGLPVYAIRLAAFTIAGSAAGLAGGLTMAHTGSGFPTELGLDTSLDGVLMVLVGGIQALSGPIVGAFAVIGLEQTARSFAAAWHPLLGLGLIAVVLLLPEGIAGASIRSWRRGL